MHQPTRRDFLVRGASAGIGLGLANPTPLLRTGWRPRVRATAKAVIQLHLEGGLSHLDSFDPKPDAPVEVRGPFGSVKSKIDGARLSDLLARTAGVADKLTLVRSLTHTEADHDRAAHSVLTGYQPSPAITYPSFGAVVAHELGVRNDLPPYVVVPAANSSFLGTGYLSAAHAPFAVGGNPANDKFRVRDLAASKEIDEARREQRRRLLHDLDARFPELGQADAVLASEAFYRQAWSLIESPAARAAFDLAAEPDAQKDRYGRTGLGMSCLLARRLAQAGSRYIVVTHGGYDHHYQIGGNLGNRLREVDQALAALLADLDASGLLEETLVLVTSEFGRTPRLNGDAGRDHWARVFSCVLAGAGIKRGHVHGASNSSGAEPEEDPVRPADLAATVFTLLGIDPQKKLLAPGDRPIDLVRDGSVIQGVLL